MVGYETVISETVSVRITTSLVGTTLFSSPVSPVSDTISNCRLNVPSKESPSVAFKY